MRVQRSKTPVLFFSRKEKERIVRAIENAEKNTSAEIRVHLERKVQSDILRHAREKFERLGMTRTKDRNGVLIFLSVQSRAFVILGDEGIHQKVGHDFWGEVTRKITPLFKQDHFAEGMVLAISVIAEKLKEHFPRGLSDSNELADTISYSL